MRKAPWLLLLLAAAAPAPAAAPPHPPTQAQLREAEQNRAALLAQQRAAQAKAGLAAAEERRLAAERVAAATALRTLEAQSAQAADRVADLAQRRADSESRLAERARAMGPLLPVIQRLALYPAETLLAVPMPPESAIRGLVVLGALTRQLERDASELRHEQDTLTQLVTELDQASRDLADRQNTQAAQAAALDQQLESARAERKTAEGEVADWSKRAAAEAARADGLRAAIARIESERAAAEARLAAEARATTDARTKAELRTRQEAAARPNHGPMSHLVAPVAGTLKYAFGDTVDGASATGIAYQVPPSARVVAPCSGRVVFAGPFRSFGLLMILDCGSGWHVVLSGFDRLDAQLGQTVQQAEPIGAMPSWNPLALIRRPTLQMELRQDGQPKNPQQFLHNTG
jgi:septal ring factor EnvC (AmiA/AmiB activator)